MNRDIHSSPEAVRRILRQRAAELARPTVVEEERARMELLQFQVAAERYAVEARYLVEVIPSPRVTSLPGVPEFVHGICNVRGRIWSVINLARLLGLSAPATSGGPAQAILLGQAEMEFALGADTAEGIVSIDPGEIHAPPAGIGANLRRYLLGIHSGGLTVLDGNKLLTDGDLVVHQ